jgi:hypothetical protein
MDRSPRLVEHVYALDQFKEAFKQSLKSNRSGKILFKFKF